MWGPNLDGVAQDDFLEEVTFEQRTKYSEGGTHLKYLVEEYSTRGKSKDNSPEAGMCLICLRNEKESLVAGAQ